MTRIPAHLTTGAIARLLELELDEQARWPREPVTPWREWLGDPRNEGEGGGGGGGEGGGGEGGEGGGGQGGAGDETLQVSKADFDRLQQAAATSNAELRKVQAELEKRDRKAREEAGEHQRLYEEEKARREALEAEREQEKRSNMLGKVADRLRFKDAAVAVAALPAEIRDKIGVDDEAGAEKALKQIADKYSWMVDEAPRAQRGGAGAGGNAGNGGEGNGGNGDEPQLTGPDRLRAYYAKQSEKAGAGT